jgi:hypothetical protein
MYSLNVNFLQFLYRLKQPKCGTLRLLETPKRLNILKAPENAKKVPFQAPETA